MFLYGLRVPEMVWRAKGDSGGRRADPDPLVLPVEQPPSFAGPGVPGPASPEAMRKRAELFEHLADVVPLPPWPQAPRLAPGTCRSSHHQDETELAKARAEQEADAEERRFEDAARQEREDEELIRSVHRELQIERIRRLGSPDLREKPIMQMHGAMAEVALPFAQILIGLIPVLGEFQALYEAISGTSLFTGDELHGVDRYLGLCLAALPFAGMVGRATARVLGPIVKEVVRATGASAGKVLRLVKGLGRTSASEIELVQSVARGMSRSTEEARAIMRALGAEELRGVSGNGYRTEEILESHARQTQHPTPARPDVEPRGRGELDAHTKDRLGEGPEVDGMREGKGNFSRPSWQESELNAGQEFAGHGFEEQRSYKNSKEVPHGTKGSSRPDLYSDSLKLSVDVKNYDVESADGVADLVRDVVKQVGKRARNLPEGSRQGVLIDIRGQHIGKRQIDKIRGKIVRQSKGMIAPDNVHFVTE